MGRNNSPLNNAERLSSARTRGLGKMRKSIDQGRARAQSNVPFGVTYEKIGTIQRRLAWPLHKDDTLSRSGRPTGLNIYFHFFSSTPSTSESDSLCDLHAEDVTHVTWYYVCMHVEDRSQCQWRSNAHARNIQRIQYAVFKLVDTQPVQLHDKIHQNNTDSDAECQQELEVHSPITQSPIHGHRVR